MSYKLTRLPLTGVCLTLFAVSAGPIEGSAQGVAITPPPKTWSCTGNKWVLNGTELGFIERGVLSLALGEQVLPTGCYWYDPTSGMIGREGAPPGGDIPAGLEIGGPLRSDASNGDSNIFLNGREMTKMEVMTLRKMGATFTSGRYWMNQQGIGGREGQPAEFQLSAAAQEAPPAQAKQQPSQSQSKSHTEHLYQSGTSYGGVQGDCVYISTPSGGFMGSGC